MNLIVGHMIGDYLFQNSWMALKKTSKTFPCVIHCTIYTLCILITSGWLDWRLLIVFGTHFIMDRFRLAKYWRRFMGDKKEELPYIILSDNTIHLLTLWVLSLI